MEINEFVKKFADQFDETDLSAFAPLTKFREIEEWSSFSALSIIAMVDEEYHVKLMGDDIRSSKTIEDVYNCVKSKI
jgi:acyl carrier protein